MADRKPDSRNGRIVWVQLFVDSFRGRISMLSPAAAGAYIRLFLAYVSNKGPLPDDNKRLAKLAGMNAKEWNAARDEIADVMQVRDGFFHDDLADERIATFQNRSSRNRASAEARHSGIELSVINGGRKAAGDDHE